jgi:hypothetical protein
MALTFTYENNTTTHVNDDVFTKVQPVKMTVTDGSNTVETNVVYTDGQMNRAHTKKLLVNSYEKDFGQIKAVNTLTLANLGKSIRDDVYMAGSIARSDYSIDTDEGSAIVDKLEASWSDFIPDYKSHSTNFVSEFTPLRQPYINSSISFYDMEEPSDALKTYFGLDYSSYMNFYGLKFDKTTSDVLMKVMINSQEMYDAHPELCKKIDNIIPTLGSHFFGLIYNSDGELTPLIDVYFTVGYDVVEEWLEGTNNSMPYEDESLTSNLIFWGGVYNIEQDKITHIKAYIRNYLGD